MRSSPILAISLLLTFALTARASPAPFELLTRTNRPAIVITTNGPVEYLRVASPAVPAPINQLINFNEGIRTLVDGRAAVRFFDWSGLRLADQSRLLIVSDSVASNTPAILLLEGQLFFSSRGGPVRIPVETPHGRGLTKGTEFLVRVDPTAGITEFTMFDGEVELSNQVDRKTIRTGQQGVTSPGKNIEIRAVLEATNIVQWWIYYPAVLEPLELAFTPAERDLLHASLANYQSGDLTAALRSFPGYPNVPENGSDATRIYYAALLLGVGSVDRAQLQLNLVRSQDPVSRALRTMVKAVAPPLGDKGAATAPANVQGSTRRANDSTLDSSSASALLANSYAHQATYDLKLALSSAYAAVERSTNFGFGWARVAELEFSFGNIRAAKQTIQRALELAPRNAQAHALKGFLLAAEGRSRDAIDSFDQAIAIDSTLGNAWLGRGLCRIRTAGSAFKLFRARSRIPQDAISDIQTAAALEPTRSLLRSYAGKAFSDLGDAHLARKELALASDLDPSDPTPWLYRALINREENRLNEAVTALEKSIALNDNRALYRSRLLLDQDRAVRGANLAAIYRDAGLPEVSVREGTRAVDADFGNYSSHLFLAQSYDALRDPRQVNLRYETPWFNEMLLANLLAPVGAASLSQSVSQQEYSRLLQRNELGTSSATEYTSRGDWREAGSLFGSFDRTSFSLDAYYASLNGDRPNTDLDQRTIYGKIKQQLTPQDTVFLQVIQYENTSGDVREYYDPTKASMTLRFKEVQEPNFYVGLHHEWGPSSHTLFLSARLRDRVELTDSNAGFLVFSNPNGSLEYGSIIPGFGQSYKSDLTAYSTEMQHFWQNGRHTIVTGGRVQAGEVLARSTASYDPQAFPPKFFGTSDPAASEIRQSERANLDRYNAYFYFLWDVVEPLQLSAGVAYDYVTFPGNLDLPPIIVGQRNKDQVSPKAGFRWNLAEGMNLRGTYTRSLGGTYYDASVRLEPSQIAGFNQAFRSAIPESIVGLVPGSAFETFGVALDHKLTATTFLGLAAEGLTSKADRWRGAFNFRPAAPAQYRETLHYQEKSMFVDITQLIGSGVAIGIRYRLLHSRLEDRFPTIPKYLPTDRTFLPSQNVESLLHELDLDALWNHRSGWFSGFHAAYFSQHNSGYATPVPGNGFWQMNGAIGFRFLHRRAEARLGLLNLTDRDYRLNVLNVHPDLPRRRTLTAQFSFVF